MSSLRAKLQRLPTGIATSRQPPAREAALPSDRGSVLDDLRSKMEQMRAAGSTRVLVAPTREVDRGSDLPFVAERDGRLWIRRVVLGASHRVGSVDAHLSLAADPAFLALLALDPTLSARSPRGALYLDLETTGLGQAAVPFLVGLMRADGDSLTLEQILLRDLDDEAVMLAYVAERIAEASLLVTFNGKTFDWPLLRSRYVLARQPAPQLPAHLDLLQIARRVHRAPDQVRSIKLQQLEIDLLGLERVGDIAGADIGAAYWHWLRTGRDETMRSVVDHNAWDVYAMAALLGLYGRPLAPALEPGAARGLHDFLPQVAWTLQRAGASAEARDVADRAVAEQGSTLAHFTRARIAKAMRDRDAALADFEQVVAFEEGAAKPQRTLSQKARLELCKLYEHHVRAFDAAHRVASLGTGEDDRALGKRLERLARKQATALRAQAAPNDRRRARRSD